MAFTKVADVSQISPESIRTVQIGAKAIALANVGGHFFAIDSTCPHRGGPLGEGELQGTALTCPWHGWQFDLTTGRSLHNPNAGVGCFATEVRGDEVFVDLP
jgi:nitrite reductase (NADH) small subunit